MPVYDDNILPAYDLWTLEDDAYVQDGALAVRSEGSAHWQFNTKDFNAGNYALITCPKCTGVWFFYIAYLDTDSSKWYTETVSIPNEGIALPIILQQAKVDVLLFNLACKSPGIIQPISFQLIEQAIRSVDIEYASGTSKVVPPETGWQTNAPEWQTGRYIWQRTATTFVDGHTEYSDPILIQNINASAIYNIEEQYYLSNSNTKVDGGSWSTEQPSWSSKKYIWTRSKITWADNSVTYSEAVLAKALNEANERAQEAIDDVEELDKDLSPDGVFNRLTDNGKRQGLYIDNGNYYFNATYIRAGVLTVLQEVDEYIYNLIFRADMHTGSVYLAGFVATNASIYFQRMSLLDNQTGTYIGTDGFATGVKNGPYLYLSNGELAGGANNKEGGYLDFNNYWKPTGEQGCRLGGMGGIFLLAPRLGITGYQHGGEITVTLGQTKYIVIPNYEDISGKQWVHSMTVNYVDNVVTNLSGSLPAGSSMSWYTTSVVQGISWQSGWPGGKGINFEKGLMVTA